MSSRDSSSSRDTVVHLLRKQERTFPATPTQSEESTKPSIMIDSNDPTPPPTIRERRGRRGITNGGFRPLSVFTNSMLIPFNQNFDEAFEVLKGDSPDRLEVAKSILSSEKENNSVEISREFVGNGNKLHQDSVQEKSQELLGVSNPQDQPQSRIYNKEATTPQRIVSRSVMPRQDAFRDRDMDLMTALKVTSPEKDSIARLSGDFTTLCELPVPDPSEHPAFASNAFEVKTEAPLLFTSTGADAIRALCLQKQRHQENPPSIGRQSIERKKSLFGLSLSTPSSTKNRNAFTSSEDTSFPILMPTPNTKSAQSSVKDTSPIATDFAQLRESTSIERSSAGRKISDLFRRKDSLEKSSPSSPVWSPRTSLDTPNLYRQDLERYLRRTTFTPTFDFDPYSPYPRHPNTGRGWKSRNLKCTTCSVIDCAVCHRVCCAYRAAVLALDNHGDDSPGRPMALQRIQEITKLFPYGKETPTFIQCTVGALGDTMGCGKMVCPDCCSICPDEACADTVCRRCKPAMWEDCDWHRNGTVAVGDYHEINGDGWRAKSERSCKGKQHRKIAVL